VSFRLVIEALEGDAVRVAAEGDLSGTAAYRFDGRLREVEATRPPCMVLDLSALSFIDSAGLARVLAAHRRAQREGRRLLVQAGTTAVRRLIALTALDQQLELVGDGPGALAALQA
jgi:anti-anti-sigma factor